MNKKLSAWADISGDIHFEVFDGAKKTTWWMKGADSTSTRRVIGNAKLAEMFREMADVLETSYQARKYTRRLETVTTAAPVKEGWEGVPAAVDSSSPQKLAEKAQAVTVQGGKWYDRDDTETPFMLPNGKKDE